MTTVATIAAELILDAAKFTSGMKDAEKSADSFGKKMGAIGDKMVKVGGIMTASLTLPIVAFGTSAVKAAAESEAAIAALESTIQSTGNKTGITSKEFQDYASKMQYVAAVSDEAILGAQTMLLTFDQIGKETFPRATDAAIDLSRRFGMDLQGASIMLGKALQDPAQGLGALSRVGVTFTAEQKKTIEGMMKMNDVAGAQAVLLAAVEAQVKGAAEAYGNTAAGQMDKFMLRLDDFKEVLGTAIIPSLIKFMDALTPILVTMTNNPAIANFILSLLGILAAAGPVTTGLGFIAKAIAFFSAGGGGAAAVAWITGTMIPALYAFGAAGAAAIVPLLPILALIAAAVLLVWLVWKNWDSLIETLYQIGYIIGFEVVRAIEAIATAARDSGAALSASFSAAWNDIKNKAAETVNAINAKVLEFVGKAKAAWGAIVTAFRSAGSNIMSFASRVFGSISNAIAKLIGWVRQLASALLGLKLPEDLTPGSPTPFEIGLRGIGSAMETLNRKSIPDMNIGLNAAPAGISGASGGRTTYIDNRRFAGGMGRDELQTALDSRMMAIAGGL